MIPRLLISIVALSCSVSAKAQGPETSDKPSRTDDIVVVGTRETPAAKHRRAVEYVRSVSQIPVSGQYARWADPICPRVTGLDAVAAALVETRIRRVADDAGIATVGLVCRPNLVVMFTVDGDATLKRLEKQRLAFPRSVTLDEQRLIRVAGQAVRWWTETDLRGSDGEPLSETPNPGSGAFGLPANERTRFSNTYSSSLIGTKVQAVIPSAVVIVDVTQATGKKLVSLADHLAFMVIGRARAATNIAMSTIARLFDPSCTDCGALSTADRRYLEGLYRTPANRPANVTRAALTDQVSADR